MGACIDPIIPRFTVVESPVLLQLSGPGCPQGIELKSMALHPKNKDVGTKVRRFSAYVWLDQLDVDSLKPGQEVTLVDWGNCVVDQISDHITGRLNLDGDFRKTVKITWIAAMTDTVPCVLIDLDHLLAKKELEDGDKIEECLREVTWTEYAAVGEHAMKLVRKGDKMQIMRKGYFICHRAYVSEAAPMLLIRIPDGKS